MEPLWKLREWLTIHESAVYLSSKIGSTVNGKDILRLALDGHLQLSVDIPGVVQARFEEIFNGQARSRVTQIQGLWDLVVLDGAGRLEVQRRYHFLAHLPFVEVSGRIGAHVFKDGLTCQVPPQSGSTGIDPSSALPVGSVLAVRVRVLDELATRLSSELPQSQATEKADTPLGQRERATLLTIIAALARHSGIDWLTPTKSGNVIEGLTSDVGATIPSRTIEEHLKKIPDALERRSKNS